MGLETHGIGHVDFTGESQNKRRRNIVLGAIAALLVLGTATGAWVMSQNHASVALGRPLSTPLSAPVASTPVVVPPVDVRVPSYLNGVLVPPDVAKRRPVIVSVENHQDSRPPTGLSEADIVYELPVEGGITRFLAIFQQNEPAKIGPERSARVYMLDFIKEYNGVFAHIGQDPAVLSLLRPKGINDLSDFGAKWDPPSTGRAVEHRAYTSIVKLRDAMDSKGWGTQATFTSWSFKDDEPMLAARPASQSIKINYSTAAYTSTWTYDPTTNTYLHAYGGVAHKDAENGLQISAKNVIALELKVWQRSGDEKGRKDMQVEGTGDAVIFRDGLAIKARWSKATMDSRTILTDSAGQPIVLDSGKIWVEVVPANEDRLTY